MTSAGSGSRGYVLMVGNELDFCEAVAHFLRSEYFQVRVASNGREALATIASNGRPCLVLLDLTVPVLNGWEFAEVLQADPSIPIAVITWANIQQPPRADFILRKPLHWPDLLAVVVEYCRPHS